MSVLPKSIADRIQWAEEHLATFTTNAVAIGTTALAVTDLQTKTEAARAALQAQGEKQDAAKSATNDLKLAVTAMTTAVSDIIKQVKTKAALSGAGIYSLANIPAPAIPGPKPPPGTPYKFTATLDGVGGLTVKWKCDNPAGASGTIYQVWRSVNGGTEFAYIGGTGNKQFADPTIPAGSANVIYRIQAVRSTAVGPWATFHVSFGVGSGGQMTASVAPVKIAA